jgi:hypothetical protein
MSAAIPSSTMCHGVDRDNLHENYLIKTHDLTFKQPMFTQANTHEKCPYKFILYIYATRKFHLKTCCIICTLYSTKCYLFHNVIFFCSTNTIFINHILHFKHQPSNLKVNCYPYKVSDLQCCCNRRSCCKPPFLGDYTVQNCQYLKTLLSGFHKN